MDAYLQLLLFQQHVLLLLLFLLRKQKRMWVRPIFLNRTSLGEQNLVDELRNDPESFFKYFRMSTDIFDALLDKVAPLITKMTTNWRTPIPARDRLAITLRYLATGDAKQTISFSYRVGNSTVSKIVDETCLALWKTLQPTYLKFPSSPSEWRIICAAFQDRWNFPMCVGALDGKHIVIQAPGNAGSEYFNYKGSHSIVLLAMCDADYTFTMVDIGDSGKHSDGGVLQFSEFGYKLLHDELYLPPDGILPGTDISVPHCIVADAAFPLRPNLMRPYPGRTLPDVKKIFNYRLSRARRVIENAFGIFATRWRIFRRSIIATPDKAILITKTACCLHNYLMKVSQNSQYCPPGYTDREDGSGHIIPGDWRGADSVNEMRSIGRSSTNTYSHSAFDVREKYAEYFSSANGELPWQLSTINRC